MDKSLLRQKCLTLRGALTPQQREHHAERIAAFLHQRLQSYTQPAHILCYRSLPSEVATSGIFHQFPQHTYYAPVTHQSGDMHWLSVHPDTPWQQGNFAITEPVQGRAWQPECTPAILICPLVGFDRTGNRIGMGKGCFDRWIAQHPHLFDLILGLAFSCQECEAIPHEPHDIPLHAVITEQGWIPCQNN